jgi:hypothetical protein
MISPRICEEVFDARRKNVSELGKKDVNQDMEPAASPSIISIFNNNFQ